MIAFSQFFIKNYVVTLWAIPYCCCCFHSIPQFLERKNYMICSCLQTRQFWYATTIISLLLSDANHVIPITLANCMAAMKMR